MKNVWVLSIKTSLSYACEWGSDLKTETYAFENFEKAREFLRAKLKKFAYSKNSMFDGHGNIIHFKKHLDNAWEPDDDEELLDALTKANLSKVYNAVKSIFEGNNVDISEFNDYYSDWLIAVEFKNGVMTMYGEGDGPCNGYDPRFNSNMFDMSEEKNYFLYIEDLFGQEDDPTNLCIDLTKAEVL